MPSQVPAATRTLSILRTLASASGPMTAVTIARELGLPRSSTYHLLTAMQELGFVVHLPEEERWGLGVAAFEVGAAYLRHEPLERLARPLLKKLIKEVAPLPVAAHLGVLHGRELLYLLKEQTPRHPELVTAIGVRLPASLTASGRCILAQLPTTQVKATFPDRMSFVDRTGRGPQSWTALLELLAQEAQEGFSTEEGFIAEGYSSVAVAVKDHLQQPIAAIGLTFATAAVSTTQRRVLTNAARQCARAISKRLGAA